MPRSLITAEIRLRRIHCEDDLDKEIKLSKQYAKAIRTRSKSKALSLAEKLSLLEHHSLAVAETQRLIFSYWNIIDDLAEKAKGNEAKGLNGNGFLMVKALP